MAEVRISKNVYYKNIAKKVFTIIPAFIVSLFVLYLIFAATIIRCVPGIGWVKNPTFHGGNIPAGEKVVVDTRKVFRDNPLDRIVQGVVPSETAIVGEVVAGPNGGIVWNSDTGEVTVDGVKQDFVVKNNPNEDKRFLFDQYLVKCVSSCPSEGEGFIVSKNSVYGVPIK